ncbi:hypothetical protein [Thermus thermamylovorans]|uniref:Uncharacterized protein n=1 Tax=Thermus thermamylovorans TaxID=2509362 RepID=A0A4V6MRH1_9DEIN|nr:hypothetical protein [Thermus thermamylovorans]TBH21585.1 hypothetical protein ETP66_02970 [Thermus thermamylovorans]
MRLPWYTPLLFLFLALVGLGALALLWSLAALALLGAGLWLLWQRLRRLGRPSWRRLPPP